VKGDGTGRCGDVPGTMETGCSQDVAGDGTAVTGSRLWQERLRKSIADIGFIANKKGPLRALFVLKQITV